MTQTDKLFANFQHALRGKFAELQRLLAACGFRLVRQRGSHQSWRHDASGEGLTIQPNGKEAMDYQVREFLRIVREHDLKPGV